MGTPQLATFHQFFLAESWKLRQWYESRRKKKHLKQQNELTLRWMKAQATLHGVGRSLVVFVFYGRSSSNRLYILPHEAKQINCSTFLTFNRFFSLLASVRWSLVVKINDCKFRAKCLNCSLTLEISWMAQDVLCTDCWIPDRIFCELGETKEFRGKFFFLSKIQFEQSAIFGTPCACVYCVNPWTHFVCFIALTEVKLLNDNNIVI